MTGSIIRTAGDGDRRMSVGGLSPAPVEAVAHSQKLSRGVRQRIGKRCRVSASVHDTMVSLNSLADLAEPAAGEADSEFSHLVAHDLQ